MKDYLEIESVNKFLFYMERTLKSRFENLKKDIDIIYEKLDNISSSKIIKLNYDLDKYISKLERVDILIDKKQNNLEQFQLKLEHNNPKKISSMGYSKIFQNNQSISSVKNVKSGNLIISMIDGQIETNYKG